MAKRTPALECSPENCGDLFPRCGKATTYANSKCRCDACKAAQRDRQRKYYEETSEERRDSSRRYREASPEKAKASNSQWRLENGERYAEMQRQWYLGNREEILAKASAKRAADPEAARKRERERYAAKPEQYRASSRRWCTDNADSLRTGRRQRYAEDPQRYRDYSSRARAKNPHRVREDAQRRRLMMDAAWLEDVRYLVVFDRDNWICQICGIQCLPGAKFGDPEFATLDHIIPIAWGVFRGGFHSYANCQTLCHSCNSRKGARES